MSGLSITDSTCGDIPAARFGHTTTYVGNYTAILFGGAVGDSGRYVITNDTYTLDLSTLKWTNIEAQKVPPARAAHASTCVDSMQFVVYGGATGGGSLSNDELYLLDLRKAPSSYVWIPVPVQGDTPGRRYGHSMCYYKPNLVVFGGNDGHLYLNDVWYMNVEKSPFCWLKVVIPTNMRQPVPRVYHSSEICKEGPAQGMMVVFGGRSSEPTPLGDSWGLRQHRNGRWDWLEAPMKNGPPPDPRFQHSAVFIGSKMLVLGGRDNEMPRALQAALYDTESCEWKNLPSTPRYRHSSWCFENTAYTFGGFDHNSHMPPTQLSPTGDLQALDTTQYPNYFGDSRARDPPPKSLNSPMIVPEPLPHSGQQRTAQSHNPQISTPPFPPGQRQYATLKARLSTKVHAKFDEFSDLVQCWSIDRLEDEGRKIKGHSPVNVPMVEVDDSLSDKIILKLLQPNITSQQAERDFSHLSVFCISWEDVSALCMTALEVFAQEDMVLRLRSPIKVYGDLHGQYIDLMRMFGSYKTPIGDDWVTEMKLQNLLTEDLEGDLDSNDYLFLGDFVDRGTNSLEVICLLFALKCKYPKQVHLIRGNHEDPTINSIYGFREECRKRLNEDPDHPESCWEKFNKAFEMLPVGAVIEDKILCIHGGIGENIHTVENISSLQRPLKVAQVPSTELERRVTDLLWSDPTENDGCTGVVANRTRDPDGTGQIVKFGPDRVRSFLSDNNLDVIIRAHECVMDGFERFAGGKLITLFSATDYCGDHKNAGALLFIKRNLEIVPKIIYPERPSSRRDGARPHWIAVDSRPSTPPRSNKNRGSENF
eukprot:GHVP01048238.1.p1 GENE.GHVP01048238.1~~GHVP01048238.1.p1  ORF type:complete len:819 (+),score=106.04 GHVP01048238.1:110-2566(+)